MARLPDYTALGETPPPTAAAGLASFDPGDLRSAALPGRELTAAGGEIEQAASLVAQTNQAQDVMVAEAALNRLQSQRLDLEAGDGGFKSVRGAGAVGPQFVQDYQQKFNEASTAIEQGLTNDNQRRLFQQKVPIAGLQYRAALLSHQASETDKFNTQTESDTIDLARRQVFLSPGDPQAVDAGMAQINWAIDQRAKRMGWDPVVTAETKQKFQEKVFEDSASMLVERDPVNALNAINKRMGIGGDAGPSGVTAVDGLNVDKLVELRHRAVSYVTQADNKLKVESEKRLKDAETETKELQSFALTGQMVSPEYEQQVLLKTTGTPFEAPARAIIKASYAGATHGSLPLPQQERQLSDLSARVNEMGSDPESSKLVAQARSITETQRAAYKDNPWDAASRFGHQQQVQAQPITSADQVPKLVAQRLPLMNGVEIYAGQPVSPLQPAEAKDFADKLKTLPPDARAEVLGQTGAMLSVPRAAALADQLDKHDKPMALALKMGLDRTTAGRAASALVLRGAQALEDKTVKKDDTALAGWKAEIAGLVRGTLGNDQAESDVIDAAYYVRAAQDQEGIAPAGFKSSGSGAADAVGMVIGQPIERAGVKTVLPRGMKEREFDARLKVFTPEKLAQIAQPAMAAGMTEPGNIDLSKRPQVKNADGSVSTVRSMGVNVGGQEVLIPTVSDDGRIMSNDEAVDTYRKTGRHLGKFATPQASTAYAQALHTAQEQFYGNGQGTGAPPTQAVLYVRGAPVPVAQIANHLGEYGMKRDGQGRYVPVVRNAPITLDPQGQQMLRLDVR